MKKMLVASACALLIALQTNCLIVREGEATTSVARPDIVGPVWQWVRTRYADETVRQRAAGASGYTLLLRPDGTVQVRGDCNVSGGTYTMKGTSLTVTITHGTRAACPDGSLEDAFLRDLNRTGGFVLKNGRLSLELKLDSGAMEFRK